MRRGKKAMLREEQEWGEWFEFDPIFPPRETIEGIARVSGQEPEAVLAFMHEDRKRSMFYRNKRYQVIIKRAPGAEGWPDMAHLSIRTIENTPVHDWRDFQRIKNELIGPEYEGVELYPAESRLVDGANQYHIFVPLDPAFRFPFGFTSRLVNDESFGKMKQRARE